MSLLYHAYVYLEFLILACTIYILASYGIAGFVYGSVPGSGGCNENIEYQKLIVLCTDICERNGKNKLLWLEDKDKTLNYKPVADEMVLTVHRWFANKSCPGNWMYS